MAYEQSNTLAYNYASSCVPMLSWTPKSCLRLLLSICRWLGVCPFHGSWRKLYMARSLLILCCTWFFIIQRLLSIKFRAEVMLIERIIYLVEYPATMLQVAIFSLSVFRTESDYRRLSLQGMRLRQLLRGTAEQAHKLEQELGHQVLRILLLMCCYHVSCFLVDALWLDFEWSKTIPSNCLYNLPSLIINLSLLQYVLALRLLCVLHKQLSEHVAQVQLRQEGTRIEVIAPQEEASRLEQLRLISASLDVLHAQLSQKFNWGLLLTLGSSLISFCYMLFVVFRYLEQSQWNTPGWELLVYRVLWIYMHGARIWYVLSTNGRIIEQKCQLYLLLNKLVACNTRLESVINRFLLQLQANQLQTLAVCGVVDLDTLAVGGFISALMAIIIFLVQIDLGHKSLMGYSL